MIFGGNPEHGNSFDSALRETISKLHCRQRFVDRVQRTAEQTGLLSGNDRNAIGRAQALNVTKRHVIRAVRKTGEMEAEIM